MGLFSKKGDVPELPKAPVLPKLPEKQDKSHMLPSISKSKGELGDQMVKSAVTDNEPMEYISQPHSLPPMHNSYSEPSSGEEHKKEVFVKLDKFTQAQKTFKGMKSKMAEIEALVNKAKELNEREKAELAEWGKELTNIKSKVHEIDSEVFNQV